MAKIEQDDIENYIKESVKKIKEENKQGYIVTIRRLIDLYRDRGDSWEQILTQLKNN